MNADAADTRHPHLDVEDLITGAAGQPVGDRAREHLIGCEHCQREAKRWNVVADGVRGLAAAARRLRMHEKWSWRGDDFRAMEWAVGRGRCAHDGRERRGHLRAECLRTRDRVVGCAGSTVTVASLLTVRLDRRPQCFRDFAGDVVLDGQDVAPRAIVGFRPDHGPAVGADQSRRDPQPVS